MSEGTVVSSDVSIYIHTPVCINVFIGCAFGPGLLKSSFSFYFVFYFPPTYQHR